MVLYIPPHGCKLRDSVDTLDYINLDYINYELGTNVTRATVAYLMEAAGEAPEIEAPPEPEPETPASVLRRAIPARK